MEPDQSLETVNLYRRGGELRIELNRPETLNAWNAQFGKDMLQALEAARAEEVRVVVITGAGRAFSAGADLRGGFEFTPEGHPDVGKALRTWYHPIITGVRHLEKPVVAAVNGGAVGIGRPAGRPARRHPHGRGDPGLRSGHRRLRPRHRIRAQLLPG
jgi:2-(1,2-epoxy-1,2-dihydrophenyl)acetyl-CoA isomerase